MDINRKHIFRKRENGNVWLVLLQKFKHFGNGGSVILKNLKGKIPESEGVDENEG